MKPCPLCGLFECDHTPEERAQGSRDQRGNRAIPKLPRQVRYIDLELRALGRADGQGEDDPQVYEISFSSEAKIPRWWGIEVLSHEKSAIDMRYIKRNGALLVEHEGEVVGVILESSLDEAARKLRGKIKFSRSARGREVEQDVRDGIRTRLSVGYVIVKAKLVSSGETIADDEWLITRWMPVEVSLVGIPADLSVGVGRSAETGETFAVEIEGGASAEEERTMKCKVCGLDQCSHTPEERANGLAVNTRNEGGNAQAPQAVEAERARAAANGGGTQTIEVGPSTRDIAEIAKLCQRHGMADRIAEFVEKKLTVGDVRGIILEAKTTRPTPQPGSERAVEFSEREADRYSYRQLITRPILGGGFVTAISVPLIAAWGLPVFTGVAVLITVGLTVWGMRHAAVPRVSPGQRGSHAIP